MTMNDSVLRELVGLARRHLAVGQEGASYTAYEEGRIAEKKWWLAQLEPMLSQPPAHVPAAGEGWIEIKQDCELPESGMWVQLFVDLNEASWFKRQREPQKYVTVGQLRFTDEGWPVWQRGETSSGHPICIIDDVTMWKPLDNPLAAALDAQVAEPGQTYTDAAGVIWTRPAP